MDLVDDENLVAVADRRHAETGDDDLADLVDLRVRGGVDLEHVDVAPFGNLDAGVADAAGISGRPFLAVQRAREDPGGRRLPDAAWPREDERLRDPAGGDRVAKRFGDAALADHVVESLRAPLAGEDLVGHEDQC